MKPRNRYTTRILTSILSAAFSLSASAAHLKVADLKCEYLSNPMGIDTRLPRFSWKLIDSKNSRGQKQTAFQIVVERKKPDSKVLWDSGKVPSSQSVNNEYSGGKLVSGTQCFWKVRVWDKDGKASAWSSKADFSIGLLEPADWKGPWIRYKEADNIKHIWYRKDFSLEKTPSQAFVYLASIGYHELYVNGKRIGTRVLAPAVSNLKKRVFYVTYDVTDTLRKGDNVIAVWTGPGWARSDGSYGKGVWKQDSLFRCQVNMSDGTSLSSDSSWKCRVSSSENTGLWKGGGRGEYGGELIDARKYVPDWNKADFDDNGWASASAYTNSLVLSAQMVEPSRKVETLRPVSLTEKDGRYTFDMGRNFTGWLEFDLRGGKAGDTVKFMTANRAGPVVEFKQESVFIYNESGKGTFSHRFNYMAGRWITVEGLPYKPDKKDLRCYIITNDRKQTGSFECSKPLFNRIYETDLRTYIANTVNGVTMDCPHRERFGYGEIALACSWGCGIPQFESAAYYRKVAHDWFDVQREDGFVNTIAPQVYRGAGGTLWSSAPVTLSWEFHRAYGDMRQLEQAYGPMKKWLDYLNGFISEDGVLTAYESPARFLGDWATPHGSEYGNKPEAQLFNNCVYAYCLDVIVQAATLLDRKDDLRTYSKRLEALRANAHKHFFNKEAGNYIDGRQLSMVFPLYVGITPENLRASVMKKFVEEISVRKPYLDTGSSGLPVLLKFMVEHAERADLLFPCIARTEHPSYGFFFEKGETTWPEYWKIEGQASRIHTCYTGISGYFTRAVGGIRPDPSEWGMKKFVIKPQLVGDLTWARVSSGTPYGTIISNWTRKDNTGTFDITVPPNTTATVYIPAREIKDVSEGRGPARESEGVRYLRHEAGTAVFTLESGAYKFTSSSVPSARQR